ncbi:hypothetical protein EDD22DRAFT_877918 [Suillus occidentalis]|nr:hypothetical protein EDD22DRAFT_877918 [Suillus occidentalis]
MPSLFSAVVTFVQVLIVFFSATTSELNFAGRADMCDIVYFSLSPSFDGFGTVHYLIYPTRCRMRLSN